MIENFSLNQISEGRSKNCVSLRTSDDGRSVGSVMVDIGIDNYALNYLSNVLLKRYASLLSNKISFVQIRVVYKKL